MTASPDVQLGDTVQGVLATKVVIQAGSKIVDQVGNQRDWKNKKDGMRKDFLTIFEGRHAQGTCAGVDPGHQEGNGAWQCWRWVHCMSDVYFALILYFDCTIVQDDSLQML